MKRLCLDKLQWNKMQNHILLVNDPIAVANQHYESENPQNCRLFCAEELSIELAREIIDESYIAASSYKLVLIAANSFNIYAQNALLKILEEPPNQVYFVLFARMKSQLLPTIRSRMPIVNRIKKEKLSPFSLSISTLSLRDIYPFLKEKSKEFGTNPTQLKIEIQSLYLDCIKEGLNFDLKEMQLFEEALFWAGHYERIQHIFLVLLLMILNKKKEKIQQNIKV